MIVVALLLASWLVLLFTGHVLGGLVHLLLVSAVGVAIFVVKATNRRLE